MDLTEARVRGEVLDNGVGNGGWDSFAHNSPTSSSGGSLRGHQWRQLPVSVRFDETPKAVAERRRSFYGGGLRSSDSALQARFLRQCKGENGTRPPRRALCVCAKQPKPTWVEMTPITGEAQFDEALESGNPVIIDWMATWCRKCIYLKPKLEKLAAEYDPDIKFYFVDVNTVPSSLVSRAGVTKMPTIQLWKNKEKAGEVIGGDQGWLVMDKIREMLTVKK